MENYKDMFNEYEEHRAGSHASEILKMLRDAGEDGVTNFHLTKVTHRFGGTIFSLRMDGYKIDLENLGAGVVRYTLKLPHRTKTPDRLRGIDIVEREIHKNGGKISIWELMDILEENNLHIIHKPNGLNKAKGANTLDNIN